MGKWTPRKSTVNADTAGVMTQKAKCLPGKHEALSQSPRTHVKKGKEERKEEMERSGIVATLRLLTQDWGGRSLGLAGWQA